MSRAKRVKKVVPPPEPPELPRDPRLVALAEQAERAGWKTDWWTSECGDFGWWLRLRNNSIVSIDAFADNDGLNCYAQHFGLWSSPARTPAEALRAAYAALGVALDQAEDAFGGTS